MDLHRHNSSSDMLKTLHRADGMMAGCMPAAKCCKFGSFASSYRPCLHCCQLLTDYFTVWFLMNTSRFLNSQVTTFLVTYELNHYVRGSLTLGGGANLGKTNPWLHTIGWFIRTMTMIDMRFSRFSSLSLNRLQTQEVPLTRSTLNFLKNFEDPIHTIVQHCSRIHVICNAPIYSYSRFAGTKHLALLHTLDTSIDNHIFANTRSLRTAVLSLDTWSAFFSRRHQPFSLDTFAPKNPIDISTF